jgi:Zn-dependent protease with chaperone function
MKATPKIPDEQINYAKHSIILELLILLGGLIFGIWILFLLSSYLVSLVSTLIPQDAEHRILADVASVQLELHPHPANPTVQRILDRVLQSAPDVTLPLKAGIMKASYPNAMAIPGGGILITNQLLRDAQSENEISWVIAHEVGHFKLRHHLQGIGRSIIVLGISLLIGGESPISSIFSPTVQIFNLQHSRQDEADADAYALELLNKVYGHIGGATAFMERQRAKDPDLPGEGYISSHPVSSERIAQIQRLAHLRGYVELDLVAKPADLNEP